MPDYLSLLPSNRTPLENAVERTIRDAARFPVLIDALLNPDTCPASHLGHLAWSLSVDEWDPSWPEETQREALRQSVPQHRRKSTVGAVKDALRAAGYGDARIVEGLKSTLYDGTVSYDGSNYYNPPDHWAEYRVTLNRPITIDQAAQVRRILKKAAPVRCDLKGLYYTQAANRYNAAITYDGSFTHGVVQ